MSQPRDEATPRPAFERYQAAVLAQLQGLLEGQARALRTAAGWIAAALAAERWVWVFGSGHSHLLAGELFYRAGGLARVAPLLHGPLMLHEGAARSSELEREAGYAERLLEEYPIGAGDVLLVVSSSGRNAVPIELALAARARGARAVAITSFQAAAAAPSRHPSGRHLRDVVDVALDNRAAPGDAALALAGLDQPVGPTSTITGALLLNALVVQAIEELLAAGGTPEVWSSANLEQGPARNQALLARYRGRIRHL